MIGPHTVTVIHPAGRDDWGDTQDGDTETAISRCFWQPVASSEETGGHDTVTITARCFMPASASVSETDRLRFAGVEYAIHGRPDLHYTPTGPHHYEIQLKDVQG